MINSINSAFVWMLNWIYSWVGNYGWSVVLFTLFIRIVIMPLDIKSRKAMRDMNRIQPQLAALQKKYADDKEKLNQKTMELYKRENVSMGASCLPMLLSYPILLFMFTAMRVVANEHTVSMIQSIAANQPVQLQSWLWIKNVFLPDSFMAAYLPAFGDKLAAVSPVSYSKVLTVENIDAARNFLSSQPYADYLASIGMSGAFKSIQLNFGFFAPTINIPTSWAAFTQNINGLFILPVFAAVSQFLMTKVMSPRAQKPDPRREGGDGKQSRQQHELRFHEVVLPSLLPLDLRNQQRCLLHLLDGSERLHDSSDAASEQVLR
jgi:membrane protein insertase, YidC/Oxa1 family, C-terminal domain